MIVDTTAEARRASGRLTALQVPRLARKPGMHADGAGLYLQVTVGGASWVLRYMRHGRARYMGLGSLALYGLKEARARVLDARRLLHAGVDPIESRREAQLKARLDAAKTITFKECADRYMASHKIAWRNARHANQWDATLKTYAYPIIGSLPVQQVDTGYVTRVLGPIWMSKPETAKRLRGRLERILDWAKVSGYRTGENPAHWRGHLDQVYLPRAKVRPVRHHAALPYDEMSEFMVALRAQEGTSALALEFAILTAARTGEVIGARWREINLTEKTWTVPAERMKAGKEHRVPLSQRAVEIISTMKRAAGGDVLADAFVFTGRKPGQPLSNMAFLMLLRRMKRAALTAHGFRSSFRDWAAEHTSYPSEVAEMALAHAVGNKVEAAYRRGDLFERRRKLMATWATFCMTPQRAEGNVAPLRATQ